MSRAVLPGASSGTRLSWMRDPEATIRPPQAPGSRQTHPRLGVPHPSEPLLPTSPALSAPVDGRRPALPVGRALVQLPVPVSGFHKHQKGYDHG